jgi:rare lipoprotein A
MPLPSYARVTNLANGFSMIVRVNDRGPYSPGRIMDVSSRVADMLDFKSAGTAKIKVEYVSPAPLAGTDDSTLVASLRTDGKPATFDGSPASPTMVADAEPQQSQPRQVVAEAEPQQPAAPPRSAFAERPRDDGPPFVAAASPKLLKAPPPPARPFDLSAIARVLNAASAAPLPPPRRPLMQASAGERTLYFADRETPALRRLRSDPFAQITGGDSR